MSLFHVQEWFNVPFLNAHSMCVANLVERREQVIVGTLNGTLTVLDPGKEPEKREEIANLAELHLAGPVLQLLAGTFLPSTFEENVLAVLLPNSLLFFRLITSPAGESFACEQVFEHKIGGAPAFNMCSGFFGRSTTPLLCVQNLQGVLHIFEAENKVLQRPLPDILHPGPIGYSSVSESLLIASGTSLRSVRYVSLTAIGTKRVNADWILPLGDIAVQMFVLNTLPKASSTTAEESTSSSSPIPVQPSILVLCKRALHCVTHGGNPRFTIRFQTVALCLTVLSHWKDAHIPLCIGTGTKTVLFYSDTRLIWSGQLPFAPQQIGTCTFSESLRSMLALLSDEGNLFIGYLGTEPSLFRMPVTESRFIDFESRKKELREFEEIIWRSTKKSKEGDQQQQSIDVRVDIDQHSASFNAIDGVPSATLTVSVPNLEEDNGGPPTTNVPSTMCFKSELFCVQGNQWTTTLSKSVPFSATIFCHERPVLDPKCQICILSTNEIRFANFCVPLALICREVNAQRQANIKISLDSTKTALDLATVFPEFTQTKERNSLGFQPFFGEQRQNLTVSLFVSTKMNRYRIQSDSCDFLYAILSCLVERVHQLQPDVQLRCPIPMHLFLGEIAKFIEAENQFEQLEKEACRVSVQMRQVETVFLSATKCGDGEQQNNQLTNIGTLLNYTHRELANSLDKIANVQQMLSKGGRHSLRSLLNLMNALFKINEINLPFDGSILDGTDQKLSERIVQLLSPADVQLVADLNSAEIGRLLAELLEKGDDSGGGGGGGKLGGIAEEDEDEAAEEEENEDNAKREEERERRELQEAIAKSEQSLGLAELRSGSLPVKHHLY